MRLVNRLDVPLLAPSVGLRILLKVADLTESRPEDNPFAKPAHGRHLDIHANSAALRNNDAANISTIVAAQIYVTISIGDGQ